MQRLQERQFRGGGAVDLGQRFESVAKRPHPPTQVVQPDGVVTSAEGGEERDGATALTEGLDSRPLNYGFHRRLRPGQKVDEAGVQAGGPALRAAGESHPSVAFGEPEETSTQVGEFGRRRRLFQQKRAAHVAIPRIRETADGDLEGAPCPQQRGGLGTSGQGAESRAQRTRGHAKVVDREHVPAQRGLDESEGRGGAGLEKATRPQGPGSPHPPGEAAGPGRARGRP